MADEQAPATVEAAPEYAELTHHMNRIRKLREEQSERTAQQEQCKAELARLEAEEANASTQLEDEKTSLVKLTDLEGYVLELEDTKTSNKRKLEEYEESIQTLKGAWEEARNTAETLTQERDVAGRDRRDQFLADETNHRRELDELVLNCAAEVRSLTEQRDKAVTECGHGKRKIAELEATLTSTRREQQAYRDWWLRKGEELDKYRSECTGGCKGSRTRRKLQYST